MKRLLTIALLVGALTLALCCAAYAAGDAGIYDLEVKDAAATVTVAAADGAAITPETATIDDAQVQLYAGAAKLCVTVPSTAEYVLITMLSGTTPPTAENLRYIDQKAGSAETSFVVYPDAMTKGVTYSIYAAEAGADAPKLIATFKYNTPFLPGDVDGDGAVTETDALWVLQYAAGNRELTEAQLLLADVTGDSFVAPKDALWILQAANGNRTL